MRRLKQKETLWALADQTQGELLELCSQLVRCPNVNPPIEAEAITALIEAYFQKYGIPYEKHEPFPGHPVLIATVGDGTGGSICINGHTDTVPPGDGSKWAFPPYCGTITDTQVLGRGTSDMLCGVAIGMHMARLVVEKGLRLHGNLVLHLVPDEESGGEFGSKWLVDQGYADGLMGALFPEPTSWCNFEVGQKGGLRYLVKCSGTQAHASVCSFHHDHAALKMLALLERLDEMRTIQSVFSPEQLPVVASSKEVARTMLRNEQVGDAIDHVTYNVNAITCGGEGRSPMEYCTANVNFGIPVGVEPAKVKAAFDELIRSTGYSGITYEILRDREPCFTPADAEIVQVGLEYASHLCGKTVVPAYQWAASDAKWYRYRGIPALQYGPANIDGVHGYSESADIEEIMNTQKTYWAILDDLLGIDWAEEA